MDAFGNGVLVIDKPAGISSAGVVARIKRALKAAKVGHAGTLDPFATGVLVVCLNRATKLSRFFLHDRKSYEGLIRLGVRTDTLDSDGRIVGEQPVPDFSADRIESAAGRFTGEIRQTPPAFSALKQDGVPLYKLARKGEAMTKPPRTVKIHRLVVTGIELPFIRFSVDCSAGTYIRSLADDIGAELGCGGHLAALRRTESAGFTIGEAIPLDRVETDAAGRIIPMAEALRGMPHKTADAALARKIENGVPLSRNDLPVREDGLYKIVRSDGSLLAVIRSDGETLAYLNVFN